MSRAAAISTWVAAGLVMALAANDPAVRVIVLAAAWGVLTRSHLPGRRLRPLALGVSLLALLTMVANALLSHTGKTVLTVLPGWLPLIGGTVTVEAVAFGAAIALGLAAAVSVTSVLSLVVDSADLVDTLPGFLARTGAAVGSALNLVPAVAASISSVVDAQRLRGWRPRGPRDLVDLVIPVLLESIERSLQLAESMEARAFGSGKRTSAVEKRGRGAGWLLAAGSLVAVGAFAFVRIGGLATAWYPYPTFSVPSLRPADLLPPLLLAAAGVLV
ncbi:MAG: energy-coupling factor transporter transmembrane component T family protein [Acidimicrobiales bacterium]